MIIIKYKIVASFIAATLLLSQAETALNCLTASAKEGSGTLVIRHIAKTPQGEEHILGIEEIENITDVYYYRAAASPVASKFLKNGYSLSDEKNSLIEADVVSNIGKIDLEYTPSVQSVKVTYFKEDGGSRTEMGEITDSAYVGEEYKPLLPVYEGEGILTELADNKKYVVQYGENNFEVSYTVKDKGDVKKNYSSQGDSANLMSVRLNRGGGFISGYPDNMFRPENRLTKGELFTILYNLSRSGELPARPDIAEALKFLSERKIVSESEGSLNDFVTWTEFYGYMEKLNERLPSDERIIGHENERRASRFKDDRHIKRVEAVVVINEMLGEEKISRRGLKTADQRFDDVNVDYWAYSDIMRAVGD